MKRLHESRLFKILYYLLEKGQATAPELASKFEVSVRTIYRDIDVMSSAGIPVYAAAGRDGGIKLYDDFIISKALLSESVFRISLSVFRAYPLPNIPIMRYIRKTRCSF